MASAERSCASDSTACRMFIVAAIYPDAPKRATLSRGSVLLPSSCFRKTWQYASGPSKPPIPAGRRAFSPLRAACVHVQGRNPLGLRFLRRFRLARTVEGDRLANERLKGGLVNFFSFVDVDCAAYVSVETRVEETGRILQRRALGEGKLHDILVGFASADDAVVRPNRSAHPLPLLDH